MIEHIEHFGNDFKGGIEGKRVAIVGYAHYDKKGEGDKNEFTIEVISDLINFGKCSNNLLGRVQKIFGFDDARSVWERVLFFNYIPENLPFGAEGNDEQQSRGNARFIRLIEKYKPDLMFVFSVKAQEKCLWKVLPGIEVIEPGTSWPWVALHEVGGHTTRVIGLRHTNRAGFMRLKDAVRKALGGDSDSD